MPNMRQAYNFENPKKQIKEADPLPDKLRDRILAAVRHDWWTKGSRCSQKAIELRPDYADAMAYQSLLLRQKADQSDSATRAALEKQADGLLDKVKEIKQQQAAAAETKS